MILIRYLLICIIGYLIVRFFLKAGSQDRPVSNINNNSSDDNDSRHNKKVSKEIGEYVDYEEVKKEKEKQHR